MEQFNVFNLNCDCFSDFTVTSFRSVPEDGFLVGCVFAIADYPEQMADKQLLATWKRVRIRIIILQFKPELFSDFTL